MTAVLFESFFVDNATDKAIGDTVAEQSAFGVAYAKAILEYLGVTYKAAATSSAAAGSGKLYRVQVGAFSKRENAEKLMRELKDKGDDAFIKEG
jgi:N-acetylmuramoyl-L-alanine amidase